MAEEFVISVDMLGTGPMDFTRMDFADGPHVGRIEEYREVKEGKGSHRFTVTDLEEGSATKGVTGEITIGSDMTKRGNRGHLANLLVGVGAPADKIKGKVDIKISQLIGKNCYFFVKSPPEGELTDDGRVPLQNRNFITRDQYESLKRVAATVRANGAAKTNGAPAQAKPASAPVTQAATAQTQTQAAPTTSPAASGGEFGDLFTAG